VLVGVVSNFDRLLVPGTGDVLVGVVSSFDRLLVLAIPVLDVLRDRVSAHAYV
jgi:hypothetical protein